MENLQNEHNLIDKYLNDIDELGYQKALTLSTKDVAKILGVTLRTLENWRRENLGPNCKKIGKSYIYTKRDVAEFLAQN
uniref:helix-turn-helix domain-containing protein n=1 Tax=Aliarcobacter sp. TaxID=2321116 RepID=UPI0040472647